MIRIVNLRNYVPKEGEVLIKVDRSSSVGNPFYMASEGKRDEVCDQYEEWFKEMMTDDFHAGAKNYIKQIIAFAKIQDVALGCWCAPKRCHAETIKAYVESHIC
jgi:hypothetical protein